MDKAQLRKSLYSFFHQRKAAYRFLISKGQPMQRQLLQVEKMEQRFDLIAHWNYWRHCLEVSNLKEQIAAVLPSASGSHRAIRERMEALIRQCQAEVTKGKHGVQLGIPGLIERVTR